MGRRMSWAMIPFLKSPALTRGREVATAAAPGSLAEATEQAKQFSITPLICDGRDHCINLFSFAINAEKASCEGWKESVGPQRPTLQSRGNPLQLWSSCSLIHLLSCMAVDPHTPIAREFLGMGTGTQDSFLRGGEIMWIYVDFLSYNENSVFELSEWLKPKSPSESLCVAVMGKEEERKGSSWGWLGGRV